MTTRGDLTVAIFNRDFTPRAVAPPAAWRVTEMTWASPGGPERAELLGNAGGALIPALWADLLRAPVEITQRGLPVWWGFVNSVELCCGGRWLRVSMDEAATSVRVDWRPSPESSVVSLVERDETQIVCFGERQRLIVQDASGDSLSARTIAQTWLTRLSPPGQNWIAGSYTETAPQGSLRLGLRGWWHTLGWRYRSPIEEATSSWEAVPDEDHALGYNAASSRGAQPFLSPVHPLQWRAYTLRVNLRKVGNPTDRVRVSIQADAAGNPSGIELDAVEITTDMLTTSLSWIDLRFENLDALIQPGQVYQIVFQRTGSLSTTNYYRVGVDLLQTPLPGIYPYRVYNGSSWSQRSPMAVAVYALRGAADSLLLAAYYAHADWGGQFIQAIQIDSGLEGRIIPVKKSRIENYRAEINALLNLGSAEGGRVLAEVTPLRGLRFYPAAQASEHLDSGCRMDESGQLCQPDGVPLPLWHARAGIWAQTNGLPGTAVFLERIRWDGHALRAG